MPLENGISIAKELREISPDTGIVFTTTSLDHAVDAFSLDAVHYLVKPVTIEGVREAFSRVQKIQFLDRRTLSVKSGRSRQLLYLDEIFSIESFNHECIITMMSKTEIRTRMTLMQLQEMLDDSFLRLQRGLIVNMMCIEQMKYDRCILRNGQEILLSRKERSNINNAYNDFVFRKL